jgi:hypothetical protein
MLFSDPLIWFYYNAATRFLQAGIENGCAGKEKNRMEQCFSGYCRALDASRVVMADTDDGAADCDFPACLHVPVCKIAAELREFLGEMVEEPAEQTEEK